MFGVCECYMYFLIFGWLVCWSSALVAFWVCLLQPSGDAFLKFFFISVVLKVCCGFYVCFMLFFLLILLFFRLVVWLGGYVSTRCFVYRARRGWVGERSRLRRCSRFGCSGGCRWRRLTDGCCGGRRWMRPDGAGGCQWRRSTGGALFCLRPYSPAASVGHIGDSSSLLWIRRRRHHRLEVGVERVVASTSPPLLRPSVHGRRAPSRRSAMPSPTGGGAAARRIDLLRGHMVFLAAHLAAPLLHSTWSSCEQQDREDKQRQ